MLSGEIFGSLCELDFEISIVSLRSSIGLPLDIISKCMNIFLKPTEPKVSPNLKGAIPSSSLTDYPSLYLLTMVPQ